MKLSESLRPKGRSSFFPRKNSLQPLHKDRGILFGNKIPSSFKDPSGFVFTNKNRILRQINLLYKDNYEFFIHSGLYQKLTDMNLLVTHRQIKSINNCYKTIEPQFIPFISYPYEWCFSQLKDAALLTLLIQKISLDFGMSLKDATSFNVQFLDGKPIFIDTLSFEKYQEGKPWVAYKQFCEQFLAPLALFSYKDMRLNKLLQSFMGSIPLDLAANLLPLKAKLVPSLFVHIFLHSNSQKKYEGVKLSKKPSQLFSRQALMGLIENLEDGVKNLNWRQKKTVWADYASENQSYEEKSLNTKKDLVGKYLDKLKPKVVWDMGANTGLFSRIAAKKGIFTISLDNDFSCVEKNYIKLKKEKEKNILPLCIDIINPSPSLGWEGKERFGFLARPYPDTILALALIHHLAISDNLPLSGIAQFFAKICKSLIIEFVPKDDKQVQVLLQNREDIFPDYNQGMFEKEFGTFFAIKTKSILPESKRVLYLMRKR